MASGSVPRDCQQSVAAAVQDGEVKCGRSAHQCKQSRRDGMPAGRQPGGDERRYPAQQSDFDETRADLGRPDQGSRGNRFRGRRAECFEKAG
jgi:hypothetical protein